MHRSLSTLDTGSVLVPMSFSPSSTSGVLLRDCTLGDTVGAQEWIARELGRIREDTKPRHCRDYEALLQVIEEMSRYVPALSTASGTPTSNANKSALPLSASSSSTNINDTGNTTFDVSISSTSAPHQQSTNMKPTALLRFNDLEMALVHIIQYHQRCDLDTNITINASNTPSSFSNPARLLQTLDKLYAMRGSNGGNIGNPSAAQDYLFSILFGEVRLTSQLVAQWGIVCQWAKQLPGTQDWHGWMNFGLDAYAKAKQQCSTSNDSSTELQSPTKSASSSSSSNASTNNREHQRMIEQLPMLLYNTHLVEEYQA
ncbi:hypothetical protein K492DRAFT_176045 [Lichtheimia hyalospora FSU 10163]|nr:hypothetical protein K492DRAFT_176045 [Lichtheimia hyalospora FSU 10163]